MRDTIVRCNGELLRQLRAEVEHFPVLAETITGDGAAVDAAMLHYLQTLRDARAGRALERRREFAEALRVLADQAEQL